METRREIQYVRILKALKKRPKSGMTNFELMMNCHLTCPEKRIREMIDRKGIVIKWEPYKRDRQTVYTLEDPNQEAIKVLLQQAGKKGKG